MSLTPNERREVERMISGGNNDVAQEDWHVVGEAGEPAYQNSWVSYDSGTTWGGAKFMKDSLGFVHIRGLVKSGTANTVIFTLPSGYRPANQVLTASYGTGGVLRLDVWQNGDVNFAVGSATSYGSILISFRAEQ